MISLVESIKGIIFIGLFHHQRQAECMGLNVIRCDARCEYAGLYWRDETRHKTIGGGRRSDPKTYEACVGSHVFHKMGFLKLKVKGS